MTTTRHSSALLHKTSDLLFIVLFCLGIALPIVDNLVHLDPTRPLTENRPQASKPVFKWNSDMIQDYPKAFEAYFQDYLGFRNFLILWNNRIHVLWLRTSPIPDVVLGKQGWLFLGGRSVDYYRGTFPFTMTKIARIARILEERQDWLAEQNIPLLYIFTPEKSSIYPEYIPDSINRVNKDSFMDHVIEYLRKYTHVQFLDLRGTLLKEKKRAILFQRTGTHWNSVGAYLAYREMIELLSHQYPELKPLGQSELSIRKEMVNGFDLATMLGLNNVFKEERIFIMPKNPVAKSLYDISLKEYFPRRPHFATEIQDSRLPRLVMFRDSFAGDMIPFLSENFRRIAYIYQPELDTQIILKEKPDLVIMQMAERTLIQYWVLNSEEISYPYLEKMFFASKDIRFNLKNDKELVLNNRASLLIFQADILSQSDSSLKITYSNKVPDKWTGEYFFTDYIRKVFHAPAKEPRYLVKEESCEVKLKHGRYTYYLPIDGQNLTGNIEYDVLPKKSRFKVLNVEIRNVPYPHEILQK